MKGHVRQLKKILNAQQMMEQGARARVAQLQIRQQEIEQKFENAKQAAENSNFLSIFSDFYIRHLHQLTAEQVVIAELNKQARHEYQIEKKRSEVLRDRLKAKRRFDEDKRENENLLELVNRMPVK